MKSKIPTYSSFEPEYTPLYKIADIAAVYHFDNMISGIELVILHDKTYYYITYGSGLPVISVDKGRFD